MTSARALEIRLLGPLEVLVDGVTSQLRGQRAKALLAVLALSAGEPVSSDTLIARVWGELDPPADPRGNLHTYVRRLRNELGSSAIAKTAGGYLLDLAADRVDAGRFLALLDRAELHRGDQTERRSLDDALRLWRGAPFGDLSAWLSQYEAPRLTERYLSAVERRADLDLAVGRYADSVAQLRELTAHHPLREPLWARLLVTLDRAGRHAEALEAYDAVRRRLADELGVDPSPELRRIYASLLEGADPNAAELPQGTADIPASRTGDRAASAVPRQLPADLPGFTGRADVVAELDDLLDGSTERAGSPIVIALHGGGGIGKTTLALHCAHRVADRFPDGQLFVDLRGYGPGDPCTPAEALDGMLRGLGISGAQIPEGVDVRSALLRSTLAGRRVLIILDNARNAEQVRPLLPGAGTTAVVVTSRSELRGLATREGARRVAVETLSVQESVTLLRSRLLDHQGPFRNAAMAELAELCGYLPLALAVAAEYAGRSPDGLGDLVRKLGEERDRLGVLDSGDDTSCDLRSVFSWSYQALDPESARMFRLTGLHPTNQFSTSAAAALIGSTPQQAERLLDRLVETNLLRAYGGGRYSVHDLVREYANELVDAAVSAQDRETAISGLDSWYVQTAANARATLKGPTDTLDVGDPKPRIHPLTFSDHHEARAWFGQERVALVTLIGAGAQASRHTTSHHLARLLYVYLDLTRGHSEAIALCEVGADSARTVGDQAGQAASLAQLGGAYMHLRQYDKALVQTELALELYRKAGDRRGEWHVTGNLALLSSLSGRPDQAIDLLQRQLDLAQEQGMTAHVSHAQNNLAGVYLDVDRPADAARLAEQAVEGHRAAGQRLFVCEALDTLGTAYVGLMALDNATTCFGEALGIAREFGNRWAEAMILRNLSTCLLKATRFAEARRSLLDALDILDELESADTAHLRRSDLLELLDQVDRESA